MGLGRANWMVAGFSLLASACSSDGATDATPDAGTSPAVSLVGGVEKGPFVVGSAVTIAILDGQLDPTGQVFTAETLDDAGRFAVDIGEAVDIPVLISGEGFYYNEVTGELSGAPITLRALDIASAGGAHDAYVNVFTHLKYPRIRQLVVDGATVVDAAATAEAELRIALGIGPSGFDPGATGLEMTILGGDTDANAYLFAVSAVLVQAAATAGGALDAVLQEELNTLALDFADDGELEAAHAGALLTAEAALDIDLVETQLAARLAAIGSSADVPDLDRIIDHDLDGTVNRDDNCPVVVNVDQADADSDGDGDLCDSCPLAEDADQLDSDGDELGDVCDNCPLASNPTQGDQNGNGIGDACDLEDYIKASNSGADDLFGMAMAISGDNLVVSAWAEDSNATGIDGAQDDNSLSYAGAVYAFARSGMTWTQIAYIKSEVAPALGTHFGKALGLDGDTLAVLDEGSANPSPSIRGVISIFARTGDTWTQQARFGPTTAPVNSEFGDSIALSGDSLVVGAPNNEQGRGAAFVFTRSGTTWTQQAYLTNPLGDQEDAFGSRVAINGDTIVIGAPGERGGSTGVGGDESDNSVNGAGAVYVYTRSGTTWSQQAYVKASNTRSGDAFGSAVTIYGDTLAVGAPLSDNGSSGINGDQADFSSDDVGAVYVFTRAGSTWTQQAFIKGSVLEDDDQLGIVLALEANRLLATAPGRQGRRGVAYVFDRSGGAWSQTRVFQATNAAIQDCQPTGAADLSGDSIVMGMPGEDSEADGINGDQSNNAASFSGAAYVFQY